MDDQLRLSDFIAAIKDELAVAQAARRDKMAAEDEPGLDLNVKQLTVELEVRAEASTSAKGGVKFWVVSGAAAGSETQGQKQRVTIVLEPVNDLTLGTSDK
jgi:uncharacterized membrane protein